MARQELEKGEQGQAAAPLVADASVRDPHDTLLRNLPCVSTVKEERHHPKP